MQLIRAPKAAKRRRRRLTGAQRRATILAAALSAFADKGYAATSIGEVASLAGMSKAVLYDHFESKRDVHAAVLEAEVEELLARGAHALAAPAGQEERLRAGFDAFFRFVEERPAAARLIFGDAEGAPEVAATHRRVQSRATAVLTQLFAAEGDFLRDDPERELTLEMFAQAIKTGLNGLAVWWGDHPDVARARMVDRAMWLFWTGLDRLRDDPSPPRA